MKISVTELNMGEVLSVKYDLWLDTEEEAREIASGEFGNGDGKVTKKTERREYYREGNKHFSVSTTVTEELEIVTKFTEKGKLRRDKYLKDLNCQHTRRGDWIMFGAGCQKDYEKRCLDCGIAVEFA
jgi:hypothetical protein